MGTHGRSGTVNKYRLQFRPDITGAHWVTTLHEVWTEYGTGRMKAEVPRKDGCNRYQNLQFGNKTIIGSEMTRGV